MITRLTGCPADLRSRPKDHLVAGGTAGNVPTHRQVFDAGRLRRRPHGRSAGRRCVYRLHLSPFLGLQRRPARAPGRTELCDALGVDQDKLPRIVEPWDVIGEVKNGQRPISGSPRAHPSPPAAATRPPTRLGRASCGQACSLTSAGTASVLAASTDTLRRGCEQPCPADDALGHPRLCGTRWPISAAAAQALRWFRDHFFNACAGEKQPCRG